MKNVLEPDHFQQSITAAEIVAISAKRQTASSVVGNVQTRHIHSVAHVILLPINEQPNTVLQHRRTWLQRLATAHDGVPQFVDHLRVEEGWIALAHRVEAKCDRRVDAEREITVENALLCIIGGYFGMTESCFFRPDLICSVHRSNSVRCAVMTCWRILLTEIPSYSVTLFSNAHHITASPIEGPRQIVARAQRQNRHGGHMLPVFLLNHVQHPANRAVRLSHPPHRTRICRRRTRECAGSPPSCSSSALLADSCPEGPPPGSGGGCVGTAGAA